MPFKTKSGTHYHMTEGCCNAFLQCDTKGLNPCSICCGTKANDPGPNSLAGGMQAGTFSHGMSYAPGKFGELGMPSADEANDKPKFPKPDSYSYMSQPAHRNQTKEAASLYGSIGNLVSASEDLVRTGRDLRSHEMPSVEDMQMNLVNQMISVLARCDFQADSNKVLLDVDELETLCSNTVQTILTMNRVAQEYKAAEEEVERRSQKDELTGLRNENAYAVMKRQMNDAIKTGMQKPFAIISMDVNGLKHINDTIGHNSGSRLIQRGAKAICDVFVHSPVFRTGGDEYVVVLMNEDYDNRATLMRQFQDEMQRRVMSNIEQGILANPEVPVLASGMEEFQEGIHGSVEDVFDVADERMYVAKRNLKAQLGVDPDRRL